MCELFGFSRVEATISTFALLVLALEAVAIGAFFDLKQQQAVKRITKEAEIRLDPFRYIVVEEVRAQA